MACGLVFEGDEKGGKKKEERAQKEGRGDPIKSCKEGTPKTETKSRVR